ncbi:MAG: immunity 8 family protein [Alphaproteobacteria bacterium]|nr:immunity 8 family protein [Alphaproteobacteria bacterium]
MRPVIHSIWVDEQSARTWVPEDDFVVAKFFLLEIGPKRGERTRDEFFIRVATPRGLLALDADNGILAAHPLVVIEKFDFNFLSTWFEKTVASCEAPSWPACIEKLQKHFRWEFDSVGVDRLRSGLRRTRP